MKELNEMQRFLEQLVPEKPKSTLGFATPYPTLRDHPLHTPEQWLEGKRTDDRAENLWRINDSLYDLTDFIEKHPGGQDWLKFSKGTDITEAFTCHHLSNVPETIVKKFYVREAKEPRNTPFTLKDDGFYKTLKSNCVEALKTIDHKDDKKTKLMADCLFFSYLLLALAAAYFQSYVLGFASGIFLSMTAIAAHNFFHQRDNFRMHYFDFSLLSSKGWRISHVLSHHIYTNTIYDLEISAMEPWFQYLPVNKHPFYRYISWLYSPIVYLMMLPASWIKMVIQFIIDGGKSFHKASLLPIAAFTLMYFFSTGSFLNFLLVYGALLTGLGLHFGFIGVTAAHHHPDIFHDGDKPSKEKGELDWGIHILDTVMDKTDITGNDFLVLTTFGDHCMHHLFPTLDHGILKHLYPVLYETCKQFDLEYRITTQLDLMIGQFKQLAKVQGKLQ
ncbi:PREDICTED: cytochrome b5-related protein-like isoform X2 [Nicrophorus vespilloides]|uniref:Cytochrome b5-related protein-like isoform X2 n=1 Tax=Nicrophorus vespilloides TaxID=110193 RepID=A0ABM1N6T5_NICVS|nr:PREDICTED: cytochrome b5-related protein-like isoform X2 [Nicrophorus vespilloides]